MRPLPVLFFDGPLPDVYRPLVEGRATPVGPEMADLAGADGVIAGAKIRWDAEAVSSAPNLKVVSRTGVGYDNVDVTSLAGAGVKACHTPTGPLVSTAEHTITLMLAITKRLPIEMGRSREGLATPAVATALELDGAVLGLIGFGRIARRVAQTAKALGMEVLAHDPYLGTGTLDGCTLVKLDVLLAKSDVVSLHAPGDPETRHLINADTLALMKPTAFLVNCARGSLVDQDALLAALEGGRLAGAALDVTDPEPLPVGHPLLGRDDVIVTPHVASSTSAGRHRLYKDAIDYAIAVIDGRLAAAVIIDPVSA
jgi:D-3-phosphoglycerate dehydrogenase / 2-oxoglutarate reductase